MSELEWRHETFETYERSAVELAEYFRGIGPRIDDIDLALELAGQPERPKILEIGCGDGRDAKEIIKRAGWYLGFDTSHELIRLAREQVPEADFEVGNATNFNYPPDLDIIFAFASLLHLNQLEVETVLGNAYSVLKPRGIFYISLKYAQEYRKEYQEDKYGRRMFYYYNPETIEELAGKSFETVHCSREVKGSTEWFEIALQKGGEF